MTTPTPEELEDLAARCESAEGRSTDLDHAIHDLVGDNDGALFYTASLDAAMTLVPERWMRFDVDATAPELGIDWTLHGRKEEVKATAATPALALCAAALRAIAKERG